MSVKTSLLLLFGALAVLLSFGAIGFFWAAEQSLAEQGLIDDAREQLIELHTFSTAAYRQAKEVVDVLVLRGGRQVEQLNQAKEGAAASLRRIMELNTTELEAAEEGRQRSGYGLGERGT